MTSPLRAVEKNTKLEDIIYRGTIQELRDWLHKNDNKITSNHKNLWWNLESRISDVRSLISRLNTLDITEEEKAQIKKKIRNKSNDNLIFTELILKAVDQKSLELLTKKNPPNEYPFISYFLYSFCDANNHSIDDGQKLAELFVNRAKGKLWFDDFGLAATNQYAIKSILDEISETCVDLVAESFVRPDDWKILEDKHKRRALIKKVLKQYHPEAYK